MPRIRGAVAGNLLPIIFAFPVEPSGVTAKVQKLTDDETEVEGDPVTLDADSALDLELEDEDGNYTWTDANGVEVTHPAALTFIAYFDTTDSEPGKWLAQARSTGTTQGVRERRFDVLPRLID